MQAYSPLFAKVYNKHWRGFANRVAPLIFEYYESTPIGKQNKTLLDVCCGTGQLSVFFLEKGYRVVGLDLSEGMLAYARENALPYLTARQANFVQGNAANFSLDEQFGLVVSTFDALNHLPDEEALLGCFRSSFKVLVDGGYFIFDLNTASHIGRWNGLTVVPDEDVFLLNRGIYDEQTVKAWTKITGFVRNEDGLYERFDETVYNTLFEMEAARQMLLDTGFSAVYFARVEDLSMPIEDPEQEKRVFFVANKG